MLQVAPQQTYLTANNVFSETLYNDWLKYVDASEETNTTYSRALKQFALFLMANGITEPTREDIYTYKSKLLETRKPATVSLYLTVVKNFFSWLDQEGIYKDVAKHIKPVKVKRTYKKDPFTAGQIKVIVNNMSTETVEEKRNHAMFLLMSTTGLRTIEVQRSDAEDLRTLGNDTVLFIQGKGHNEKDDYVKIPEETEKAIREYLAVVPLKTPTDPLFTSSSNNSKGKRLSTRSIRGIIKTELKKNGYNSSRLTAHSLRHSTATINMLSGGTLEETQQLLRHENIGTTMIYNQALKRINNNSELRVAQAIFSSM